MAIETSPVQSPASVARREKGTRVPTFRETRKVAHLDSAGREALHGPCRHLPKGSCPIEAAETVAVLRAGLTMTAFIVGLCWLLTIAIAVVLPNWTMLGKWGPIDVWWAGAALSGGESAIWLAFVPRNRRAQQQDRSVAAAGPDWDPWPVAVAWKGRRPRRWGALPWWWW